MQSNILKIIYWVDSCWKLVMDHRYNPLRHIPDPSIQAYFTLVLFSMWRFFFGLIATYFLGLYGYNGFVSFIVHASLLIPLLFTRAAFIDAERDGSKLLLRLKKENIKY